MKKIYIVMTAILVGSVLSKAQTFTSNSSLVPAYNSNGCKGVVDMNNDGYDDIVILDLGTDLYIAYQQSDGTFDLTAYGSVSTESQWGMSIGDIDNDGHKDVICGGSYDNVHVVNINGPGDFAQTELTWASIFYQGSCIGDINNDGWLDAYLCHDDGEGVILANSGTGTFTNGAAWIDMDFSSTDDSGNYGSTFSDFDRDGDTDLFIAKCRQFVDDPYDQRRTNKLLVNDGNNNFTEEADERGLVNLEQSWTVDFVDLDNDGDFDCFLTTHSATLQIYENDGTGNFTNVTAGSGLEDGAGMFLQAKWADFDNDGYMDLLHSGWVDGYYRSNGNMTFTYSDNKFVAADIMHSFGIGDLNHDGWLDVHASYGDNYVSPDMDNDDRIFLNNGGTNNFIVFDLEGTESNKDGCGAIVEIHGSFGVKIREVRDGESYGITNTGMCHFGLGSATSVDFALVYWPSGIIQMVDNPIVNAWTEVIEEACATSPTATISATGSTNICPGETVTLNIVNSEGTYQWNNGESTPTITVGQAGTYSLIVWNEMNCAGTSNSISVSVIQNTPATVTVSGDVEFCEGNSVQLIASSGSAYLWSNNAISQAISITSSGTYYVEITNECEGSTSTSESIEVVVYDTPNTPVLADITLNAPGTATFNVVGGLDVRWFDAFAATVPIATGNLFTTPVLSATTSYWVEDVLSTGGGEGFGGRSDQDTDSGQSVYYSNNNPQNFLLFDAAQDLTIQTVKVFCDQAGNKQINVVQNGSTISTTTVNVPVGETVITLNLFVPQGTGYGLSCSTPSNHLWRDKNLDADYDYPFDLNGLVTITGTNVGTPGDDLNYYYYFYDWTVEAASVECASGRDEVQVVIVGIEELVGVSAMSIYPNPTSSNVSISFNGLINGKMQIQIVDQVGRVITTNNVFTNSGANNFQMDLSALAAGIYNVQFTLNGNTAATKLIVQ